MRAKHPLCSLPQVCGIIREEFLLILAEQFPLDLIWTGTALQNGLIRRANSLSLLEIIPSFYSNSIKHLKLCVGTRSQVRHWLNSHATMFAELFPNLRCLSFTVKMFSSWFEDMIGDKTWTSKRVMDATLSQAGRDAVGGVVDDIVEALRLAEDFNISVDLEFGHFDAVVEHEGAVEREYHDVPATIAHWDGHRVIVDTSKEFKYVRQRKGDSRNGRDWQVNLSACSIMGL
jgi:hypothetical protein